MPFPFNLKLTAQLTFYAGVVLAFSAAAGWLREDAKNDARVEIRAEFSAMNETLLREAAARQKKLDDLQRVLQTTEEEAARLQGENSKLLEKQRETIPLSEACTQCRVPNERLWLRRPSHKPKASAVGVKGS